MDKKKKTLFTGLIGILWLLAVMLAYAYTHKPFSPEQVFLLLKASWQLVLPAMIISLSGGIGTKIFPKREGISALALLAIQSALGLGVLGLIILLMGATIGFSSLYFAILLLASGIIFRTDIKHWWHLWGALSKIWKDSKKFDKVLAVGIGFILATTLATALAPPIKFDALVYHLTLPKVYLLEGRINYVPELIFWGMPQQVEMLYTFAMALAGAEAAAVLGWAFGVLTLTGLLGYLADRFSPRAAWVALASLLAGGTLSASLSWAYLEWSLMLYGLSIFILLEYWLADRERSILRVAALLAGFMVGIKYTAGVFPVAVLPIIFLANRGRGIKSTLRDVFTFGGIALLTFSPWLLKNFLATGNPVYPLLFPSGEMNSHRLLLLQNRVPWGDLRDFFLLPWRATIWGMEGKIGYAADIGSLLLGLSVFSWLGWKDHSDAQRRLLKTAMIITLTGLFIWAAAGRVSPLLMQSRLYFFILPVWAILAGIGFERFSRIQVAGIRFGRVAAALVLLTFGFNFFAKTTAFVSNNPVDLLLGTRTSVSYREQALGEYDRAISALPADARVLMLWETRAFACIPLCEPDEVIDRWRVDLHTYGNPDALLEAWRIAGYTHLLYNKLGADFVREEVTTYSPDEWRALDMMLSQVLLLEDFSNIYQLYDLESQTR